MKELFRDWIFNLVFFSLFTSMITRLVPGKNYLPYIKVFCGIMMIVTFLQPVLRLSGLEEKMEFCFMEDLYEAERRQMEQNLIRIEEEQKRKWEEEYEKFRNQFEKEEEKESEEGEEPGELERKDR